MNPQPHCDGRRCTREAEYSRDPPLDSPYQNLCQICLERCYNHFPWHLPYWHKINPMPPPTSPQPEQLTLI
jgi:hypothetical protein